MDRRAFLTAAAAGAASIPLTARAWLLPAPPVERRAERRLVRSGGLQVALRGVARPTADGPLLPVSDRWVFGRGATGARVDVAGPDTRTAFWQAPGSAGGDVALLPSEASRRILPALFGQGSLRAVIDGLGVDLRVQSLALLGDRVAHVLGAEPRGLDRPQVWIDQDDYAVLRVRFRLERGGYYDLQLSAWEGPPAEGAFPQRLVTTIGGRLRRQLHLDRAQRAG